MYKSVTNTNTCDQQNALRASLLRYWHPPAPITHQSTKLCQPPPSFLNFSLARPLQKATSEPSKTQHFGSLTMPLKRESKHPPILVEHSRLTHLHTPPNPTRDRRRVNGENPMHGRIWSLNGDARVLVRTSDLWALLLFACISSSISC